LGLNVDKLKAMLKTIGCKGKQSGCHFYIMLPDNFPWYGGDKYESETSRTIAVVSLQFGVWVFTDVWPTPDIRSWIDEPLGIEMREGSIDAHDGAMDALKNFDCEQFKTWLENKIGEVSKVAKKFRKLSLNYCSKDYVV
jgi:hypothetical protein